MHFIYLLKAKETPSDLLNKVDLTTLERKPDTFVKVDHHKPRNADFVYSVKRKNGDDIFLYIHCEHQSTHDEMMAIRLLEYHAAIIRAMIRAQKGKDKKAVPIITFVVYHGAEEWDSPTSVAELFSDFDLYMKCLQTPFLVNLGKENIKDLLTHEEVACVEVLLAAQARHDFKGNMKSIVEATKNKKKMGLFQITYNLLSLQHEKIALICL